MRHRSALSRWRATALVAATLVLSGCGPVLSLNAGVKVEGVDVFFGRPAASPPPPPVVRDLNPLPNFPAPLEATFVFQPQAVPPPPPPASCPVASVLAAPDQQAPVELTSRPAETSYPYRFVGTETESGKKDTLPAFGVRTVKGVTLTAPDGSYSYTVEQSYDGQVTSMDFHVDPVGAGGSTLPGETPAAGIYLTGMRDDKGDAFSPAAPGVLLVPLVVKQGTTFQGGAVDPRSAQSMEIDPQGGVVKGHVRVDACGTVLDSWQVEVTGKMVDANSDACPAGTTTCGQQKTFDLTFDVGTQFGGLLLSDHLKETGTDESTGATFVYDIAATINVKPGVQPL